MRNWDDFIEESKHYLSGAGYNEEGHEQQVRVNENERYLIVANNERCLVIKLSAFSKLTKKQRDSILSAGIHG